MRSLYSHVTISVTSSTFECFISKCGEVRVHTMKSHRRSRDIAPFILHLDCRWRWVVSPTPRQFYPRGRVFYFVDLIWFVATRLNRRKNGQRESVKRNVWEISIETNVLKFYTAVYHSQVSDLSQANFGCYAIHISCPRFSPRILLQPDSQYIIEHCMAKKDYICMLGIITTD